MANAMFYYHDGLPPAFTEVVKAIGVCLCLAMDSDNPIFHFADFARMVDCKIAGKAKSVL